MQLTNFYLSGHSFGGFVVGNYALKHHQHIKKLLLMSPIGVLYDEVRENMTEEEKMKDWERRWKGRKGPPAWARSIAKWGWGKKISPFSLARFVGRRQTLKFIGRYVERRQKVESETMGNAVRDYMYQIFMRPGTTEFALMVCFDLGLYSKLSLGHPDKLCSKEFPIPVSFIYGAQDWVRTLDQDYAKIVVSSN